MKNYIGDTKFLTTPELVRLNEKAIKFGLNRSIREDTPLDPDGIHLVTWTMLHNDRDVRMHLLVKLERTMDPAEVFLDVSIEDFLAIRPLSEVLRIMAEQEAPDASRN